MKHIFNLVNAEQMHEASKGIGNMTNDPNVIAVVAQRFYDEAEHKRIVGEIFKGVEEGICSWSTSNYKGEWTTDIPMVWKEVKELKQKYLGEDGQH